MILNIYKHDGAGVVVRLVMTCLLVFSSGCAWSLDLGTVFENTAVTAPSRVAFREERHNSMLKAPIVLTGYLEYLAPQHLRKVIETPFQESFLIADDQIEISQDGKTRRLSMSKSKPLQVMLGGIEAILAGQVDKLAELFDYKLSGTQAAWSLCLEPRSRRIASHLKSMLVKGDGNSIRSIRIDMNEGEWSLMDILHAEAEP